MSRRSLLALGFGLGLVATLGTACGEKDHKLRVTGLEPERGDMNGDTYVVIKGNGFLAEPRTVNVYFGSKQGFRKGTVVRFASDSQLIVRSPGGKPGEIADVMLKFEPGGDLTIPKAFTFVEKGSSGPSIDDLAPTQPKK